MPMTATERVQEINAKTRAWVAEDPENRGAGELVEDASHWAECGIHTADELDHYLAQCNHYNGYYDINGIRPRWVNYKAMSTKEIEKMTDDMYAVEERSQLDAEKEKARRSAAISATKEEPKGLTHNPFAALLEK